MEIEPALSPAEWAEFLAEAAGDGLDEADRAMRANRQRRVMLESAVTMRRDHAAAALALHGQRFGFTREDVDRLRALATAPGSEDHGSSQGPGTGIRAEWANDLANRIAALLPRRG